MVPFRRRFNFSKANWHLFAEYLDMKLGDLEPTPNNYDLFVEIVRESSRKHIPRGCRRFYVPGLNDDSAKLLCRYQSLYENDPFSEETLTAGEELLRVVGESRKQSWIKLVTDVDLTHSSKKAWQTIKKLTGDPPTACNPGLVSANQVAHQLILNGKPPRRLPKPKAPRESAENTDIISKPFDLADIIQGIQSLKCGKAAGMDDVTVEQIKHLGPGAVSWLLTMFNSCLRDLKIPKMWRRAKVVAIPKPGKDPSDPKSYRPISLLCHSFKLFERMLLNRLTPVLETLIIPEQAGFRPGKSCTGQTLNLVQHIEDGFETKNVTGVVFVDLTAAYDTVNIRRLLTKVQEMTNDLGFVNILREILNNRRFQMHLNSSKSRWRVQKNGLPQGSVLAPALFNLYTNDQPKTPGTQRFIYADDLALSTQAPSFEDAEALLTTALNALGEYYDANALRPNPSKTQSCAFHLRNHEATRALRLSWQGVNIEHCPTPRYLGVTLDRALTFRRHCYNTKQKIGTRNNLLRRLASSSWGAAPHVLRTTGLSLSFSVGEYACPVWHRSAHAKDVDVALNETYRIITGCLKPTPLNMLYPLAGIAPPDVRRDVACAVEKWRQETDSRHPLHSYEMPPVRLKSRRSFMRTTQATDCTPQRAREQMWVEKHPVPAGFIRPKEELPPGHHLQWPTWKSLNRLRTQVGRCKENMAKWGYIDRSQVDCECGAQSQSMSHLLSCPLCSSTCTTEDLCRATDSAVAVAKFWADKI